jgi:hypothetical protein
MAMRDMDRSPEYKANSDNLNRIVEKFVVIASIGITEEDGVTVTLSSWNITESVRFSTRISDILTDGFPHFLQANAK